MGGWLWYSKWINQSCQCIYRKWISIFVYIITTMAWRSKITPNDPTSWCPHPVGNYLPSRMGWASDLLLASNICLRLWDATTVVKIQDIITFVSLANLLYWLCPLMALRKQTAICRGAHSKGRPVACKELNPANNHMSLQVGPSLIECPVDPVLTNMLLKRC